MGANQPIVHNTISRMQLNMLSSQSAITDTFYIQLHIRMLLAKCFVYRVHRGDRPALSPLSQPCFSAFKTSVSWCYCPLSVVLVSVFVLTQDFGYTVLEQCYLSPGPYHHHRVFPHGRVAAPGRSFIKTCSQEISRNCLCPSSTNPRIKRSRDQFRCLFFE